MEKKQANFKDVSGLSNITQEKENLKTNGLLREQASP